MNDCEKTIDTSFAKIAYCVSFLPSIIGFLLFMLFGFVALLQITYKGKSGFNLLEKGVKNLIVVNILYYSISFYCENYYFLGSRKYKYERSLDKTEEKITRYYSNGKPKQEIYHKEGNFYLKGYRENGQIHHIDRGVEAQDRGEREYNFFGKHFVVHGKCLAFHKNGKLSWEGFFQNGRPIGTSRYYDENGNLEIEEVYASGRLVSVTKYVDGKPVVPPEK